jgi:hypothetical protein
MNSRSWHEFVASLVRANVKFAIIGGHAVNFHGYIRTTEDLDLVFLRDRGTEATLLSTLQEFEAFWIGDEIDPTTGLEETYPVTLEYIQNHSLLMLGTTFGYVDLFDFLPGIPEVSVRVMLQEIELGDGYPYASLEWLKRLKRASNRPIDQIDLEHLP